MVRNLAASLLVGFDCTGRTSGAAALTRSKTSFFKGTGPLMVSRYR
jgi:hypothetical protein